MTDHSHPLGITLDGVSEVGHASIDLVDAEGGSSRRTTTMLAALLARSATLATVSGGQAMASITAGLAELGRQAAETEEGRRVRQALDEGRPGTNLRLLFDELGFGDLASLSPPTPLLEDFANDLALLVAPDLADAIGRAKVGALGDTGLGELRLGGPVDPIDFVVGLWLFSREVVDSIDALVGWLRPPEANLVNGPGRPEPGAGRLLR